MFSQNIQYQSPVVCYTKKLFRNQCVSTSIQVISALRYAEKENTFGYACMPLLLDVSSVYFATAAEPIC